MTRLETSEEAIEFLNAGVDDFDVEAFWDSLGVSMEAIVGITISAAISSAITPEAALKCLVAGARLGLRADVGTAA